MKAKNIIFICIFVILLTVPSLSMPFFFNAVNTEKRELASFPKIMNDGKINSSFTSDFDSWINDRIGFRNELVYAETLTEKNIFGNSAVSDIVLGKDDWLFYSDTLDDYFANRTISDKNAENIATSLKMVQDHCEEAGVDFVFTIVPNKNTLYPQYMKDYYLSGSDGNMEAVVKALKEKDVNYADLYSAFASRDEVYYQRYDSHWNYEGALIGYRTVMSCSKNEYNNFDDIRFEKREDWEPDLAQMFYGVHMPDDIQYYPVYEFDYEIVSKEKESDALRLKTECESGKGNALIFRDSFMNTAYIYFAQNFENATFSRSYPIKIDAGDGETDTVIYEIVERNLKLLCEKAPVIKAKACDEITENHKEVNSVSYKIFSEEKNKMTHIYGYFDESISVSGNDIYVKVNDRFYKAFPIYEKELLDGETSDNGFSVYMDTENDVQLDKVKVFVD